MSPEKRDKDGLEIDIKNLLPSNVVGYYDRPVVIRDGIKRRVGASKLSVGKCLLEIKGCDSKNGIFRDGSNDNCQVGTRSIEVGSDKDDSSYVSELVKVNEALQSQVYRLDDQNTTLQRENRSLILNNARLEGEKTVLNDRLVALENDNKKLRELNENRTAQLDYFRAFVHDVRGLLMPVLLMICDAKNLLDSKSEKASRDLKDSIITAENAYEKMVRLSNSVSAVAKAVAFEKIDLNYRVVSLRKLFYENVPKQLGCNVFFTKEGNDYVEVDDDSMGRVLMNLVDNAIKFSSSDPSKVTIVVDYDDQEIKFIIKDKGIGLKNVDTIFDMYKRGDNVSVLNGFGVGLAYCKMVCEAHGGTIIAENNPTGGGAIFTIQIPRRRLLKK